MCRLHETKKIGRLDETKKVSLITPFLFCIEIL